MKPTRRQRKAAAAKWINRVASNCRITAKRASRLAARMNESFVLRTRELRGAR